MSLEASIADALTGPRGVLTASNDLLETVTVADNDGGNPIEIIGTWKQETRHDQPPVASQTHSQQILGMAEFYFARSALASPPTRGAITRPMTNETWHIVERRAINQFEWLYVLSLRQPSAPGGMPGRRRAIR